MPETIKRPRDGLDNDSQASERNTKLREESPHGSFKKDDLDIRTTLVPEIEIFIDREVGVEPTSDAVSTPVFTPASSITLDESLSNDDETPRPEISANDAKTLNSEIHSLMKKADGKYYIPRTDLKRVTSSKLIHQIIMEDPSTKNMTLEQKQVFIQEVQKKAPILFALCIYARMDMRCLKRLLDCSLSDESLPLGDRHCCHPPYCGPAFRDLHAKQGSFMTPVFNTPGEHKILPSCSVLPIRFVPKDDTVGNPETAAAGLSLSTEAEEQVVLREKSLAHCGSGAYSRVYRVRIHPDHQKLSKERDCLFALKEFKDRPQIGDKDFEQERKILDELRKLSSEHIVVHYATWTQDQKYYMLFPYAECNLREHMEQQQFGPCTKKNILWFLGQLLNLADAVRNIHNINIKDVPQSSTNLASPNRELRQSAWHHDIKPQNILFFRKNGSEKGMFKIADFGSGKVHTLRSGSANTGSPNGTLTYEPPEAQYGERATSRPYDIWSLGGVFLELLLWVFWGFDSVHNFANERAGRSFPDSETDIVTSDAFWEVRAGRADLRRAVKQALQRLEESVLKEESHPFKEVVELVPQMLDPNSRTRISALFLWNRLDGICNQKKADLFIIDDDSLPKPVDPAQSALPRLSPPAHDHTKPDTLLPFTEDTLPILSHSTNDSRLKPPPLNTLAPRSGRDRR